MANNVLTNNATKLAAHGIDISGAPDSGLILSTARTLALVAKTGGYKFRPDVLFSKTCKELKSRAGLAESARLPDSWAKAAHEICDGLAAQVLGEFTSDGYRIESVSGYRVKMNMRDLRVDRERTARMVKIQDFETQLKDLRMQTVHWQEQILKLENPKLPYDSQEAVDRANGKIDKIQANIDRARKLEAMIRGSMAQIESQTANA